MSSKFKFFANLALFLFSANIAFALTCRNDYSGTSGCAGNKTPAGTCETLGYYTSDVANCGHYIYCPFDTNYKRCVVVTDSGTGCESKGYSTNKPTETGYLCKDVTVALNGVNKTCYDCVTCKDEFLITSKTCQQICENFSIDDQSYSYYKISTITSINNRTGGPCYSGMLSTHKSDCCCNGKSSVILAKCEEPTELTDCSDYPLTECPEHGVCDKCPDDNSYKKLTGCELGYTLNTSKTACIATPCPTVEFEVDTSSSTSVTVKVKSTTSNDVNKCGSAAEKGWEMYNTNTYSGNSLCYACKPRSCPDGYSTEITSQDDCTGLHEQFVAADTSFGNDVCGKCAVVSSITTCYMHGYSDSKPSIGYLCKDVQVDLGYSSLSTCQDCVACEDAYIVAIGNLQTTSQKDCNLLCRVAAFSSSAMYYTGGTITGYHDTEGRSGVCYTWYGSTCSYGASGDCYCKNGYPINSCYDL